MPIHLRSFPRQMPVVGSGCGTSWDDVLSHSLWWWKRSLGASETVSHSLINWILGSSFSFDWSGTTSWFLRATGGSFTYPYIYISIYIYPYIYISIYIYIWIYIYISFFSDLSRPRFNPRRSKRPPLALRTSTTTLSEISGSSLVERGADSLQMLMYLNDSYLLNEIWEPEIS